MPRRSSAPARRAPSRVPAPAPTAHPPANVTPQPRQPGLLGQMAATAGGVAIGSAVGHAVGHALVGGGSQSYQEQPQQAAAAQTEQYQNPCARHLEQFLQCANNNSGDLTVCYGFNEALKDCKAQYGLQ